MASAERAAGSMGPNARLTRDDWIEAAMSTLQKKSIDGVRIEVLARELGITKGSFYSYFRSRAELLTAVIETWERRATLAIIRRLEEGDRSAAEKLRTVFDLATTRMPDVPGGQLELAIRAWSRREPAVRKAVEAVDQARQAYMAALFRQMGRSPFEAQALSRLCYRYIAGRNILRQPSQEAEDPALEAAVQRIVLGEAADVAPPAAIAESPPPRRRTPGRAKA